MICPPTLIGHWYYEVGKFCSTEDLHPLQYSGPPSTRARWVEVDVYYDGVCVRERGREGGREEEGGGGGEGERK